ncbi:TPA: DNA-binding protein [Haemophilus influenzae]
MNSQNAICVNVQVLSPYVTMKKYAELSGLSLTKVKQLRGEGKLPIMDKESHKGMVLINMIALAKQAAKQE